MKVAITGHSSGIGQAVYKQLLISSYDCEFKCYSRSNGFDLAHDYQTVVDDIIEWDADFVFNNAWVWGNKAQLNIQKALYVAWADREKSVITTGSSKGLYARFMPKEELETDSYSVEKREIEDHAILASLNWPFKNKCRVQTVNFGIVITGLTEGLEDLSGYISAEGAADILIDLMEPRSYLVPSQMITHQFADRQDIPAMVMDKNMRNSIEKSWQNNT
jgi:hypothetical protein